MNCIEADQEIRELICQELEHIKPLDQLESQHIDDTLVWMRSGVEIFRIQKPDIPPKHLVVYFILFDQTQQKLLLLDHLKSGLRLPSGGHVEKNENPKCAVERECREELGLPATFFFDTPFFLTQNLTTGILGEHMDVSLWYILTGDADQEIRFSPGEFTGYQWLNFDEILQTDLQKLDRHMHRFVQKMSSVFIQ